MGNDLKTVFWDAFLGGVIGALSTGIGGLVTTGIRSVAAGFLSRLSPFMQKFLPTATGSGAAAFTDSVTWDLLKEGKVNWKKAVLSTVLGVGLVFGAGQFIEKTPSIVSKINKLSNPFAPYERVVTTSGQVLSVPTQTIGETKLGEYLYRFSIKTDEFLRAYRNDDNFYSKTRPSQKGNPVGKAYIDKETGNLYPADPNGDITITDHILNQNKNKSPFISVTPNKTNEVVYGESQIEIDFKRLQTDIKEGKLKGVEIYYQDDIVKDLQKRLMEKEKEFQDYLNRGGQSQKKIAKFQQKIEFIRIAINNTRRDSEILIKGVIPSKYIKGPYKLN